MDEFEALLSASKAPVERWVKAHVGSLSDAEDILQEAYFAAFKGFSALENRDAFLAWLLSIARRKLADFYKSRRRSAEILTDSPPEREALSASDLSVYDTLETLPERDRLMLMLYYDSELTQKQIAKRLNVPLGTVKSQMRAARNRFREAYPYKPKGEKIMNKYRLPEVLPEYSIRLVEGAPFSVVCPELMGWFIAPRLGEKLVWGMYDLPSRRLDIAYEAFVTGRAIVHRLEGVSISSKVIPSEALISNGDPINEAIAASDGGSDEWTFIAQEKDGYTRFLSAERTQNGVKKLSTFLDGDEFMNNWGFGKDNIGMPTFLSPHGIIKRYGQDVTCDSECAADIVGRYELRIGAQIFDTVCLMDLGMYIQGIAAEQYISSEGRTVLWRRFNRDDWAMEQYGEPWSRLLPENERISVNGKTYVHWYDCLPIR